MSEESTSPVPTAYPARLEVDYPDQYNRVTTLFRIVLIIPIAIVFGVLTAGDDPDGLRRERRDGEHHERRASPPACSWRPC